MLRIEHVLGLALLLAGCASRPQARVEQPAPPARPAPVAGTGEATSFDGVPIRYEVRGSGSPALVFLHGWAGNRDYWDEQLERFAADHVVVAIDLGGHGESGNIRASWNVKSLARDVQAVVEKLDLRHIVFVGHSLGAIVAIEFEDLLPWRTTGVVGVDALHNVELTWDRSNLDALISRMRRDYPGFVESFVRNMFPVDADPALVGRVTQEMQATDARVAVEVMRAFRGYDAKRALRSCRAPIFCINAAGLNDTRSEINQRYASSFDAVVLPDVGHYIMLEKPQEFDAELRKALVKIARMREVSNEARGG